MFNIFILPLPNLNLISYFSGKILSDKIVFNIKGAPWDPMN